ncbi:MAG: hypothetical protein ACRCYV_08515 [Aeromonas sp.]
MKKILWSILFACSANAYADLPALSSAQLNDIGERIYKNEAAGKRENLIFWGEHEAFPSLGIAHFIWYPAGQTGPFEEMFPALVERYKQKGMALPKLLQTHAHAPWPDRAAFLAAKNSPEVLELLAFLDSTRAVQAEAVYARLEGVLGRLIAASAKPEQVKTQFNRVVQDKNGAYALIDYINFKGEGVKASERFNGKGWGLLQVLENMHGTAQDATVMREFAGSVIVVLAQRSLNAAQDSRFQADPHAKQRVETGYMPGFSRRALTYMGIGL